MTTRLKINCTNKSEYLKKFLLFILLKYIKKIKKLKTMRGKLIDIMWFITRQNINLFILLLFEIKIIRLSK